MLVLSPALRDGARNRNQTLERNTAQEIDYDYAHEHEQPEIYITIRYLNELRLEHIYPAPESRVNVF